MGARVTYRASGALPPPPFGRLPRDISGQKKRGGVSC